MHQFPRVDKAIAVRTILMNFRLLQEKDKLTRMLLKRGQSMAVGLRCAEILPGARKLALNKLRAETTRKVSVLWKQKRAQVSTDYLKKMLAAGLVALKDI